MSYSSKHEEGSIVKGVLEYAMIFGMLAVVGMVALEAFSSNQHTLMNFRFTY